jgi:hypothetical protein
LQNIFAHEGLEYADKIFVTRSRTAKGARMETEAVVGGMSLLRATASVRKGETAEWSVRTINALARREGSLAIGEPGAFECGDAIPKHEATEGTPPFAKAAKG